MTSRRLAMLTAVFALGGFFFASFATYDFAAHLDRQVHGIHCSFVPGLAAESTETSGCQVTLMSRYSSVLRTTVWGGIPVSLPGMALFAFLFCLSAFLVGTGAHAERNGSRFAVAAWTVPLLTSVVMGYLALVELDAVCKLCIGIYSSSLLGFVGAVAMALVARRQELARADDTLVTGPPAMTQAIPYPESGGFAPPPTRPAATGGRNMLFAIPLAGVFVAVPVASYVAAMPSYEAYERGCGTLPAPEDRYNVFVTLGGSVSGRSAIEVLDPLCPSCKGLESRLVASDLDAQLHRKALLFPLDDECNWMVGNAMHPGACAISEAMLCEPEHAGAVLAWAFERQEEIMAAERARDGAAAAMVTAQFPSTRGCVGSTRIRSQLHRGLRWAVANQLPVMTPQLFVEGEKLCNEDTDLGLEYTLTRMLETTGRSGGAR